MLSKYKAKGCFYPPVKTVKEHQVLDVNKIHYILASTAPKEIITQLNSILDSCLDEYNLDTKETYWENLAIGNRFDPPEIIFIKRLLQRELPEILRSLITQQLFDTFIKIDEKTFSRELYMNQDQLKFLIDSGHHVGGHGNDHYWLSYLKKDRN